MKSGNYLIVVYIVVLSLCILKPVDLPGRIVSITPISLFRFIPAKSPTRILPLSKPRVPYCSCYYDSGKTVCWTWT